MIHKSSTEGDVLSYHGNDGKCKFDRLKKSNCAQKTGKREEYGQVLRFYDSKDPRMTHYA